MATHTLLLLTGSSPDWIPGHICKYLAWLGKESKQYTLGPESSDTKGLVKWLLSESPQRIAVCVPDSSVHPRDDINWCRRIIPSNTRLVVVSYRSKESGFSGSSVWRNFVSIGYYLAALLYRLDGSPPIKEPERQKNPVSIQVSGDGERVTVDGLQREIDFEIATFLMRVKSRTRRVLYLSRHGESEFNPESRLGGNPGLTKIGKAYAAELGDYINNIKSGKNQMKVYISTLKRTHETAAHIELPKTQLKSLDEIHAGICDGMTTTELEKTHPEIVKAREADKLNYRYPMGESYVDMIQRLKPVVLEAECSDNTLIICHKAVLRCLLGYFTGEAVERLPTIHVPQHTLMKLTLCNGGCNIEYIKFKVPDMNT